MAHHAFPRGCNNPRWNGGRCIRNGYVYVSKPGHPNAQKNGQVAEHVLVMSDHIGRPIASNEVVHHVNGVRDDNRLDNLVLMVRSAHVSLHTKGNVKPSSIAALKGHTSAEMKRIWDTTRSHERRKPYTCPICGTEFISRQQTAKYCSAKCYHTSRLK